MRPARPKHRPSPSRSPRIRPVIAPGDAGSTPSGPVFPPRILHTAPRTSGGSHPASALERAYDRLRAEALLRAEERQMPTPDSLQGHLIVAAPRLRDPNFFKAVV